MKQLREHGLSAGFVSVTERKHVTDWLEGKISDNESDQLLETVCRRGRVELHWGEKNMVLSHLSR